MVDFSIQSSIYESVISVPKPLSPKFSVYATPTPPLEDDEIFPLLKNPPENQKNNELQENFQKVSNKSLLANCCLLIGLYFLQGIPLGLVFGTIPFLLKSNTMGSAISYAKMGLFSLAGYPYSLKLLWSPIIDFFWIPSVGRRKTWIIPTQILIGVAFTWLSYHIENLIENAQNSMLLITIIFTAFISLCATQDIAVDGWALTLLPADRVHLSSTCQTLGLNSGYFLSFTVLLSLNSPIFCNKYLRSVPEDAGIISVSQFMFFSGISSILGTSIVTLFKDQSDCSDMPDSILKTRDLADPQFSNSPSIKFEILNSKIGKNHDEISGIKSAYMKIFEIIKIGPVQRLTLVLMFCKIGSVTVDSMAALKLLERGFPQADLALAVFIDFPLQILLGFVAARWTTNKKPLFAWRCALYMRILVAGCSMLVLYAYPSDSKIGIFYFGTVLTLTVTMSFLSTIMFVSMGAFFSLISDPMVGGTYMTLLNTLGNVGGLWPKLILMTLVDCFTKKQCVLKEESDERHKRTLLDGSEPLKVLATFSCKSNEGIRQCIENGGHCIIERDGYYIVNTICIIIGLYFARRITMPLVLTLESLPLRFWRMPSSFINE